MTSLSIIPAAFSTMALASFELREFFEGPKNALLKSAVKFFRVRLSYSFNINLIIVSFSANDSLLTDRRK